MEPHDLKSTPPDDAALETWLRANAALPPLPDHGFSRQVLAALPPPTRRAAREVDEPLVGGAQDLHVVLLAVSQSVGRSGGTALARGRLSWRVIREAANATMRTTTLVVMILFCSTFFTLVFGGLGGDKFIVNALANLPGGLVAFVIVAHVAIFLLGVFLEFVEKLTGAGVDLIHANGLHGHRAGLLNLVSRKTV